jgi:hypothetical protein
MRGKPGKYSINRLAEPPRILEYLSSVCTSGPRAAAQAAKQLLARRLRREQPTQRRPRRFVGNRWRRCPHVGRRYWRNSGTVDRTSAERVTSSRTESWPNQQTRVWWWKASMHCANLQTLVCWCEERARNGGGSNAVVAGRNCAPGPNARRASSGRHSFESESENPA